MAISKQEWRLLKMFRSLDFLNSANLNELEKSHLLNLSRCVAEIDKEMREKKEESFVDVFDPNKNERLNK